MTSAIGEVGDAVRGLRRNPVLQRELDVGANSSRSIAAMTVWLFLLAGLTSLVYFGSTFGGTNPVINDSANIGRQMFTWLLFAMTGLVMFLVPAFTCSAIAGERTRQTLVPVQLTSMGPLAIALGKSLASTAFALLLVISTAPFLGMAYFVGGVGLWDIVAGLGMISLTAIMLGSVGIMISSVVRSVQAAIVLTYGFVLMIVFGSLVTLGLVFYAMVVEDGPFDTEPNVPPREILAVNPFAAVASAVSEPADRANAGNPLDAMAEGLDQLVTQSARDRVDREVEATPLWRWYVVLCLLTIYTSIWVATSKLRTPVEIER